ncbi:RHS repeat-associated core domain-containing protein [Pseudomonas viridiflava]|uniref:RHS repeat-associated core domain-containing protein n=1 Tax=Pseudomonas viridiflava TaxID=33069 RepID=UPI003C6E2A2F
MTLLHADKQLLAFLHEGHQSSERILLAIDRQDSVVDTPSAGFAYTPYGHRHPQANPVELPGFTGQQAESITGHYALGNGYRAFNTVLMRFNSPDSLSPFGRGGLNAYAYCAGDPVNRVDPTGHFSFLMAPVLKLMGFKTTLKSSYKDSFATFELKNKRTAFKDINIYDYDSGSGEKHLFINAHGALPGIANNSTLFGDNKFIGAGMLINEIKKQGTVLEDYKRAHIIVCLSADTSTPFAGEFALKSGLPTIGYRGGVEAGIKETDLSITANIMRKNIYKGAWSRTLRGLSKQFNYQPVLFPGGQQ